MLGLVCAASLLSLAGGYWRVDGEGPGLLVGATLALLLWLGIRRR